MAHDRNTNEPHANIPNPHDRGLQTPQPRRSRPRQILFILIPLGFLLLVGAMLLTAGVSDGPEHSGAQAPPAVAEPAPASPAAPQGTAPAN